MWLVLDSPVAGGFTMVDMRSIYPLIMSADVDSSTAFYTEVVGLEVAFDTGRRSHPIEPHGPTERTRPAPDPLQPACRLASAGLRTGSRE